MSEGSWGGPCEFSYPRAVGKNAGEADRGQILEASMASRPPGGCGVGGRASLPLPPPPGSPGGPICLGASGPENPAAPSLPTQASVGLLTWRERCSLWLETAAVLVLGNTDRAPGVPQAGRSHTGLGAAAWSWLKGRCHLVTRRRGHPQSPWEEPPLVTKATSPRASLP